MSDVLEELLEQLRIGFRLQEHDYQKLLERYDDLNKRHHDLQAELEYLRQEVNRT